MRHPRRATNRPAEIAGDSKAAGKAGEISEAAADAAVDVSAAAAVAVEIAGVLGANCRRPNMPRRAITKKPRTIPRRRNLTFPFFYPENRSRASKTSPRPLPNPSRRLTTLL